MKIHLEFEGSEAHHFVEEYEGFIDDVATRRVERRDPGNCKLRAIITGWPATTYCTTDCKVLEELSTRSLLATLEITEEKISQVLTYKGVKYSRPWEEMEEDEQEQILTNSLKLLKQDLEVCVPYAGVLAEQYEKSEPRVMRDFDKLMELIRMSAFLHQRQRPTFTLNPNGSTLQENAQNHFVMATEYDYQIGLHLFDHIRETTTTGLSQPIVDFYEKVIGDLDEITYTSMMQTFKNVYGKLIGRDQIRRRYVDPLETVGWLNRGTDPIDKRIAVFELCIYEDEIAQKARLSTSLALKDIFSVNELKEYLNILEKKCAQNKENVHTVIEKRDSDEKYDWFYCDENRAYFLEHKEGIKEEIDKEYEEKNKSRINSCNSEETKEKCELFDSELLDQYDEETVLLQIPQEDTKIEDVIKKFKDPNKVVDTFIVLQEKGKIIAGQGYMRRIIPGNKKSDPSRERLNTWTCGVCGVTFQAQNPYRDYDDTAICEKCKENIWK